MVVDVTDSFNINEWVLITLNSKATGTTSADTSTHFWDFYINGVLVGEHPDDFDNSRITSTASQRRVFFNCFDKLDFAVGFSYGRTLSSSEILQNYNFFKKRYNNG